MDIVRLINHIFEVGSLRKMPRAHKQNLFLEDPSDTISAHTLRVTHIGYLLAKMEQADVLKVLLMCLFHDLGETRSGDQNRVHKKYVKVYEEEITRDQLQGLCDDDEIYTIAQEYNARQTLEAKIAKDADILEQIFALKEHAMAGNQEAKKWLEGSVYGDSQQRMLTASGRSLCDGLLQAHPHDRRENIRTEQRR